MKRFSVLWLVAPLVLPAAVRADAPEIRWTVSSAVERALAVHPSLAAAEARRAETEWARQEAGAARGPVASARLSGSEFGEPMLVSPIHSFDPRRFPEFDETLVQGSLDLRYTLLDSGARRQRIRQADARRDAAGAAVAATAQEVMARVAITYAEVLALAEVRASERLRVEAVRRELGRVEQLLSAGRAAELDRLRAEAALAAAEAAEVATATRLDASERELARWLAVDPESARAVSLVPLAAPPPEDRSALESRAFAASPAIARARREAAAAEAARALARTGYFPELRAVGSLQQYGSGDLDFASEWNAGLVLAIPLWDGGATTARVRRAEASRDAATAAVAEAELAVAAGVDRGIAAWNEAAARSGALERAVERLAEVARVEKLRLDVGAGTQVDYLDAEAALASTRAERTSAVAAALAARVELARLAGELGPDWIRKTLEEKP